MTALTSPDLAEGVGHQGVDQRGLADAAVAEQDAGPVGEALADLGEVGSSLRHDVGHTQRAIAGQQRLGVRQVGLGQAEQRVHAGVVRRDERAVDQPRTWLGVGQRGDDDQLVGVGHDDPLDRVVVVGGTAQHGRALVDGHDAGQ